MNNRKIITLQPQGNDAADTGRIQEAVDSIREAGGGTLVFAKGEYHTGTIYLCSDLEVRLMEGCRIIGSPDVKDYTLQVYCHQSKKNYWQSLFFADGCHDITVTGNGVINGQGREFPAGLEAYSADDSDMAAVQEYCIRPSLFYFRNCTFVRMQGVRLEEAAQFAMLIEDGRNLRFDSIRIHNRDNMNTDGIHFSSVENVCIINCSLDCGDDAVVLNRKAENIEVKDCRISSRWAGIRIGPFSDGHFSRIRVSGCEIYKTYGCAIKIQIGEGGCAEDILFKDLLLREVTGPVHITLQHFGGWEEKKQEDACPGKIDGITFENVKAYVTAAGKPLSHEVPVFEGETYSCVGVKGLSRYKIGHVTFQKCSFLYDGGYEDSGYEVKLAKEMDYVYPEYYKFGIMPCWAMYAQHIDSLTLEDVTFGVKRKDCRVPLLFDDIDTLQAAYQLSEKAESEG